MLKIKYLRNLVLSGVAHNLVLSATRRQTFQQLNILIYETKFSPRFYY